MKTGSFANYSYYEVNATILFQKIVSIIFKIEITSIKFRIRLCN